MLTTHAYLQPRSYPGRGILFGLSADAKNAIAAYFIMGRSENSRNRIFAPTKDGIRTLPFDAGKMKDSSLIIYSPVRQFQNTLIVTNGDQTDTIHSFLSEGHSLREALRTRAYEPDAPHYTPRISGLMEFPENELHYTLSILRKEPGGGKCLRDYFEYKNPEPGTGHLIHTYLEAGDQEVLPSFAGEPIPLALPEGDIDACVDALWNSLNEETRVALFVRFTPLLGGSPVTRIQNAHA